MSREAAWIGLPVEYEDTVFSLFGNCDVGLLVTAIYRHHDADRAGDDD